MLDNSARNELERTSKMIANIKEFIKCVPCTKNVEGISIGDRGKIANIAIKVKVWNEDRHSDDDPKWLDKTTIKVQVINEAIEDGDEAWTVKYSNEGDKPEEETIHVKSWADITDYVSLKMECIES